MGLYKCGSSGGTKAAIGIVTGSSSSTTKVTLGFKPKQICIVQCSNSSSIPITGIVYDERYSTTKFVRVTQSTAYTDFSLGNSSGNNGLLSIDNDGFTFQKFTSSSLTNAYLRYFAIG